jgi:hypothetical protein
MTPSEQRHVTALLARARRGGWTSCASAMLDLLQDLARRGRLVELSESFNLLAEAGPDAAPFLFESVPIVLQAYYPPFVRLGPSTFTRPAVIEDMDQLANALTEPLRFRQAVEDTVERLRRLDDR